MSNNTRRTAHKETNGWQVLALFLAAVLVVAAVLIGVFTATGDIRFGQDEEQDNTAAIGGEDGELVGGGSYAFQDMTFVSARSLTTDMSGGSYTGENASVVLTATVKPENATNQQVDWTVAWIDAEDEWAAGKTVTDYVTVTPSEDGSKTATVTCLKDFGAQIGITVTSRQNPAASDTATVDFAKRVTGYSIALSGGDEDADWDIASSGVQSYAWELFDDVTYVATPTYSNFTVDDVFSVTETLAVSGQEVTLAGGEFAVLDAAVAAYNADESAELDADALSNAEKNALTAWVASAGNFTFEVTGTGTYSEFSGSISFTIAGGEIFVEEIEINEGGIII